VKIQCDDARRAKLISHEVLLSLIRRSQRASRKQGINLKVQNFYQVLCLLDGHSQLNNGQIFLRLIPILYKF